MGSPHPAQTASQFGIVNFIVLFLFLLMTCAIGFYHSRKRTNAHQMLIVRNMGVAPVALSIMATFVSAIIVIGTPAEIYYFGLEFYVVALVYPFLGAFISVLFLPVFFRLKLTSVYKYLGLRYGTSVATLAATGAFMVQTVLYSAVALYAPSIVVANVTGIPRWSAICLIGLVGTIYTAFGGFQGVIWTDVLQAFIMMLGMLCIVIQGSMSVGGISEVFNISRDNGRLVMFTWKLDPLQRHNFWNLFFGNWIIWVSILGVSQPAVQRFLSLPSLKKAVLAAIISGPLVLLVLSLAVLSGLAIFATYATCDPLTAGTITRRDEIVPHFVIDQLGHVPGLAGLFTACVLSGALSTLSSSFNSLATVTWEDFLKDRHWARRLSETQALRILQGIGLFYGVLAVGMAFAAQHLDGVLQVAIGVYGGCLGPLLAVFCLALFVRSSNATGAITGLVIGLVITLWSMFGAAFSGVSKPETLPNRVDGCRFFNSTTISTVSPVISTSAQSTDLLTAESATDGMPPALKNFYSISYILYSVLGFLITFIAGLIVSILTGGCSQQPPEEYISPLIRCGRRGPISCKPDQEDHDNQGLQMENLENQGFQSENHENQGFPAENREN